MDNSRIDTLDVLPLTRAEAARVAAATPGPDDRWAEGFPREDDADPASGLAAAETDPAPFGVYKLIPREHGRVIGTAGFFGPPDEAGEVTIGYGMVESDRARGHGTKAVAALVAICRAHGRITAINADTDLDNIASQRVLEKNGFTRVRTTDELCYYLLRLDS